MKTSYTMLAVVDALFDLLQTKDYQSVTVHELCRRAGICKRTFYNHFKDKYEVLPWFWSYNLDPCLELPLPSYSCESLALIYGHFAQFQRALRYHGQNSFADFVASYSVGKYRRHISSTIYQKYDPELVENALLYASLGMIYGVATIGSTGEKLREIMDTMANEPDRPLRLFALNIFADYLSYPVLPEGKHI